MRDKTRVLVVAGDVDTLTRLYIGLLQFGFHVEVSDRIEDAHQRLLQFKPNIILAEHPFFEFLIERQLIHKALFVHLLSPGLLAPYQDEAIVKPFKVIEVAAKLKKLSRKKK